MSYDYGIPSTLLQFLGACIFGDAKKYYSSQNECIVPRWLDRFLDLIGVNVLDCRRAGAEQNPTDHIAP